MKFFFRKVSLDSLILSQIHVGINLKNLIVTLESFVLNEPSNYLNPEKHLAARLVLLKGYSTFSKNKTFTEQPV